MNKFNLFAILDSRFGLELKNERLFIIIFLIIFIQSFFWLKERRATIAYEIKRSA
ncbi:MAG: hypothetical protein ACQESP_12165 [Candidatus Muiribacteriota bacterium]